MIRTVSNAEILRAVDLPSLIRDMREAYEGDYIKNAISPPRSIVAQPDKLFGAMSSVSNELNLFTTKMATFVDGKSEVTNASVNAYVLAFSTRSGMPLALLEGNAITMIKCAAVCGLVTEKCTGERETSIGILGAGALARAQLWGISTVRKIADLAIYNRGSDRAEAFLTFARRMLGDHARVGLVGSPAAAALGRHIVCTATSSASPLLLARDVEKTTHLNCMGAHDVDTSEVEAKIFADRLVIVEDKSTAVSEGGHLHAAAIDLTDLLKTSRPQLRQQQTLFSSTGHAFLDLLATAHVLKKMGISEIPAPAEGVMK
ncbi:ornithine cyclodeaminase family protein [Neorhizobium sp. DAR64860/K0K1]|uniref:ornithine cyclodeaminase family protein n=1 Tax=Neorhizobium sp. DAR64860/K0K1 TaxID=3421955 RepID=UPI003D26BECF